MCTLTIVPTETGYLAGMNRDEVRTRPRALPPALKNRDGISALFPSEPDGGTWIACNQLGNLLALLNWNLAPHLLHHPSQKSRGTIIPGLISASDYGSTDSALRELLLGSYAPFRLVGAFPAESLLKEWSWNGSELELESHPWVRHHWFSSSLSDASAAAERGRTCETWSKRWPHTQSSVRRLHRSHTPQAGAFSLCVHRPDAASVSYTEIGLEASSIVMSYLDGSPCQKEEFDLQSKLKVEQLQVLPLAF